jgi:hypothetical protein
MHLDFGGNKTFVEPNMTRDVTCRILLVDGKSILHS